MRPKSLIGRIASPKVGDFAGLPSSSLVNLSECNNRKKSRRGRYASVMRKTVRAFSVVRFCLKRIEAATNAPFNKQPSTANMGDAAPMATAAKGNTEEYRPYRRMRFAVRTPEGSLQGTIAKFPRP